MRYLLFLITLATLGCGPRPADLVQERFREAAQERFELAPRALQNAQSEEQRIYLLGRAAKDSIDLGKTGEALRYAEELQSLLPNLTDNWIYGTATQDANVVLGRLALLEGRIDEATQRLTKSVQYPDVAIMPTFGPNMSLAKDLLESGETDAVLSYFELCRKFWKLENGKLDQWSREVKAGRIPNFGSNLVY